MDGLVPSAFAAFLLVVDVDFERGNSSLHSQLLNSVADDNSSRGQSTSKRRLFASQTTSISFDRLYVLRFLSSDAIRSGNISRYIILIIDFFFLLARLLGIQQALVLQAACLCVGEYFLCLGMREFSRAFLRDALQVRHVFGHVERR